MSAKRKTKPTKAKVIVYVSGGVVQGVRANCKNISVEIFDVDDKNAEGKSYKKIEDQYDKLVEKHYPEIIY